jgi:GTP-binding protein
MLEYLSGLGVPTLIVLTKADKLVRTKRERQIAGTVEKLGLDADQVVAFSSLTGAGRDELLDSIAGLLEDAR